MGLTLKVDFNRDIKIYRNLILILKWIFNLNEIY